MTCLTETEDILAAPCRAIVNAKLAQSIPSTQAFPRHNRYAAPPWCEAVSWHQAEKVFCWSKALLECEADNTRRFTASIIPITKDKMAANLFAGVLAFWDKLDMDMFLKDQEKPAATSSSANETSAASSCIHRTADGHKPTGSCAEHAPA